MQIKIDIKRKMRRKHVRMLDGWMDGWWLVVSLVMRFAYPPSRRGNISNGNNNGGGGYDEEVSFKVSNNFLLEIDHESITLFC